LERRNVTSPNTAIATITPITIPAIEPDERFEGEDGKDGEIVALDERGVLVFEPLRPEY
jgi:hypothetical protein